MLFSDVVVVISVMCVYVYTYIFELIHSPIHCLNVFTESWFPHCNYQRIIVFPNNDDNVIIIRNMRWEIHGLFKYNETDDGSM